MAALCGDHQCAESPERRNAGAQPGIRPVVGSPARDLLSRHGDSSTAHLWRPMPFLNDVQKTFTGRVYCQAFRIPLHKLLRADRALLDSLDLRAESVRSPARAREETMGR